MMSASLELESKVPNERGESTDDLESSTTTDERKSKMSRPNRAKPWHRSQTRNILIVLWTIFTICLGIMLIVIFVQPQWFGGTDPKTGVFINFGLYRQCSESGQMCSAKLAEFSEIPSSAWKTATIFVALAICSTFLSILIMAVYWLAIPERSGYGFRYATGFQIFTAFILFLVCLIYPGGWNTTVVTSICGPNSGAYKLGKCEIKWAYGIAIISMIDATILAVLSFFFIEKKVVSRPMDQPPRRNSLQMNGGPSNDQSAQNADIVRDETTAL